MFVAGKGAHFDGDVTAHTKHVLDEIEKELVKAGSSMQKVLKVSVFLHDLNDYKAMNEAYKGRFGSKPLFVHGALRRSAGSFAGERTERHI